MILLFYWMYFYQLFHYLRLTMEDFKFDYCSTCLSKDRNICQVPQKYILLVTNLLPSIVLNKQFQMCWECMNIIYKTQLFCNRAEHVEKILIDYACRRSIKTLKSYSCLGPSGITTTNYISEEEITNDHLESEINDRDDISLANSSDYTSNDVLPDANNKQKLLPGNKIKNIVKKKEKLGNIKRLKSDSNMNIEGKVHCEKKNKFVDRDKSVYRCKICGKMFQTRGVYEYHYQKHKDRPRCSDCGKTFVSKSVLWTHNNLVHKDVKKYVCNVCNKIFFTEAGYQMHTVTHQDGSDIYYCKPCEKFFKTNSSFRKHQRTSKKHLDPNNRKFSCKGCDKKFLSELQADEHYNKMHLNISKIKCNICSKEYFNERSLKVHTNLKHENMEIPRNKMCEVCGQGFKSGQVLAAHKRRHGSILNSDGAK